MANAKDHKKVDLLSVSKKTSLQEIRLHYFATKFTCRRLFFPIAFDLSSVLGSIRTHYCKNEQNKDRLRPLLPERLPGYWI